jgi:hypothetical protein
MASDIKEKDVKQTSVKQGLVLSREAVPLEDLAQRIRPTPTPLVTLCNLLSFCMERLLAVLPTLQPESHPFSVGKTAFRARQPVAFTSADHTLLLQLQDEPY